MLQYLRQFFSSSSQKQLINFSLPQQQQQHSFNKNNNQTNNNNNKNISITLRQQQQQQQLRFGFQTQRLFRNINIKQLSKDALNRLHPQFEQPLKKGTFYIDDYKQLHINDLLQSIRQIDLLCIKTSSRSLTLYNKCKQQSDQLIRTNILIPFVNSTVYLYQVSNLCMLKHNDIEICSNVMADHVDYMFKMAVEKINKIKENMQKNVPEDVEAPVYLRKVFNNQIQQNQYINTNINNNINKEQQQKLL